MMVRLGWVKYAPSTVAHCKRPVTVGDELAAGLDSNWPPTRRACTRTWFSRGRYHRQPQRWDINAAQPGRATATVAHGCHSRSNDVPPLRCGGRAVRHPWRSDVVPAMFSQHLWDMGAAPLCGEGSWAGRSPPCCPGAGVRGGSGAPAVSRRWGQGACAGTTMGLRPGRLKINFSRPVPLHPKVRDPARPGT